MHLVFDVPLYRRVEDIMFLDRPRLRQHRRQGRRKTYCPLCNLNTFWNILVILDRNVIQDQMTCHVQERQHWLSYFWSHFPFLRLK